MSSESLFSNIPSQWTVTTLGELAKASGGNIQTGPFGSQLHASDYVDDGVPSIMPKNISVDGVITDDIARVSPEDVERLSKYKVQLGDIVYSRRGDVEKCARITEKEDGWLCGTGCLRVRVKPSIASTEYLHAYLCHPSVREWIVRHAVGATMPNLNTSILSSLPVVIPSNAEMTTIASTWLAISDKIQLNLQINQTLEQMAQTIFESWFVDFEPVKAKIAALDAGGSEEYALLAAMQAISSKGEAELTCLQAEQPEQYAELRTTAELFPSAMLESELGEIPEGWKVAISGDVIDIRDGTHDSPKKADHGYPLVTSKHITSGTLKLDDAYLISKHDFDKVNQRSKVDHGDILLTMIGTVGASYFVTDQNVNFAIKNVGLFKTSKAKELSGFFYLLLRSDRMKAYLESRTAGTTQKYLSLKTLRQIDFVIPAAQLLASFSRLTDPIFAAIQENSEQASTLSTMRDTLLPKLLSGELSISDDSPAQLQEAN